VLCCAVLCCAVLCCAVLCCAVLCCACGAVLVLYIMCPTISSAPTLLSPISSLMWADSAVGADVLQMMLSSLRLRSLAAPLAFACPETVSRSLVLSSQDPTCFKALTPWRLWR
jgi:hypothetical protein